MTTPQPPAEQKPLPFWRRVLGIVLFFAVINGLTLLLLGGELAVYVLPVANVLLVAAFVIDAVRERR